MTGDKNQVISEAITALERARTVTVTFKAWWTQLDDLPPAAEQALTAALATAFEAWAAEQELEDVGGPGARVSVGKLFSRETTPFYDWPQKQPFHAAGPPPAADTPR